MPGDGAMVQGLWSPGSLAAAAMASSRAKVVAMERWPHSHIIKHQLHLQAQGCRVLWVACELDVAEEHSQDAKQRRYNMDLPLCRLAQLVKGVSDVLLMAKFPGTHQRPALRAVEHLGGQL